MQIIQPINRNDISVIDTDVANVQEDWANIAYPEGKLVIFQDLVYQAKQNVPVDAGNPNITTEYWLVYGSINKLKPFDGIINSTATRDGSMWYELNITARSEALAFLSMRNVTSIIVSLVNTYTGIEVYQNTIDLFDASAGQYSSEAVLIDLPFPGYHKLTANITLLGTGTLYLGGIIFGQLYDVGTPNYGASTSIIDYSTKNTDIYGTQTILERSFSRKMDVNLTLPADTLKDLWDFLTAMRSTPLIWIASDAFDYSGILVVYGFYKDFSVSITNCDYIELSLNIEGLAEGNLVESIVITSNYNFLPETNATVASSEIEVLTSKHYAYEPTTNATVDSQEIFLDTFLNSDALEMTFNIATDGESLTIPALNVGSYAAVIEWGDGDSSPITSFDDPNLTHIYETAGVYQVLIHGIFPAINFENSSDKLKLLTVDNFGHVGHLALPNAFSGCTNMTTFTPGDCDTSKVTDMSGMFAYCTGLTYCDLRNLEISKVTTIDRMFQWCSQPNFLVNIDGWVGLALESMEYTFQNCTHIEYIDFSNAWIGNVTNLAHAFESCTHLTTLSGLNTPPATSMHRTFAYCLALQYINSTNWDVSNVTDMTEAFRDCQSLATLNVANWDVSNIVSLEKTFFNCIALTDLAVTDWNIANCTNFIDFLGNTSIPTWRYDLTLVAWEQLILQPSLTVDFGYSTYTCVSDAATAKASIESTYLWTFLDNGPFGCPNNSMSLSYNIVGVGETLTIPAGNVGIYDATIDWGDGTSSAITAYNDPNLSHTYTDAGLYDVNISGTFPKIHYENTFDGQELKLVAVNNLGDTGLLSLYGAFQNCANLTTFIANDCNTTSITSLGAMFKFCPSLDYVSLETMDLTNVTSTYMMFYGCTALLGNLALFYPSNISNFSTMFYQATGFNDNITGWDVSSATNMSFMFHGNIGGIKTQFNQNISTWNTSAVNDMSWMFRASEFNQPIGTWDTSSVTTFHKMFEESLFNQDIGNWNVSSVTDMSDMFTNGSLTQDNYDLMLIGWGSQVVQTFVTLDVGNVKYTPGPAASGRQALVENYNWTINDGGILETNIKLFGMDANTTLETSSAVIIQTSYFGAVAGPTLVTSEIDLIITDHNKPFEASALASVETTEASISNENLFEVVANATVETLEVVII